MGKIIIIIFLTVNCFSQDFKPPKILKVYLSEKLLVTFNEPMDSNVLNPDSYFIAPVFESPFLVKSVVCYHTCRA